MRIRRTDNSHALVGREVPLYKARAGMLLCRQARGMPCLSGKRRFIVEAAATRRE